LTAAHPAFDATMLDRGERELDRRLALLIS
jgi:hypothetical protein